MTDPESRRDREIPGPPARGTSAAEAYFNATHSDLRFFFFLIDRVAATDWIAYVAEQALAGKTEYKKQNPTQLATSNPGLGITFLRNNRQALLEMFVSRLVDNFQKYLVDLIRAVLRSRPAMLSTSQQSLTLEELLKYGRIEDLVHDIIERKVNSLSYEGFDDLHAWCLDRGIPVQVPDPDRDAVVELIATRNVIAHNRGFIDEHYMRTVVSPRFQIGAARALEPADLFGALALLNRVVFATDEAALQKFGLNSVEIGEAKRGDRSEPPDELVGVPPTVDAKDRDAEEGDTGDVPRRPA